MMKRLFLLFFTTSFILSCSNNKEKILVLEETVKDLEKENQTLKTELVQLVEVAEKLKTDNDQLRAKTLKTPFFGEDIFKEKSPDTKIQILTTGYFHGNEISENIGKQDWYALVKDNEKFFLKKEKVSITPAFDHIMDVEGDTTGKQVGAQNYKDPVLLIKGLDKVSERAVKAVDLEKSVLYPGERLSIEFGGKYTVIYAYGTAMPEKGIINYYLQVGLSKDSYKTMQILGAAKFLSDRIFEILWAGDLDNDGELDLILNLSNHYNMDNITLFLSSMADKNEVLKKVAEFRTVGC